LRQLQLQPPPLQHVLLQPLRPLQPLLQTLLQMPPPVPFGLYILLHYLHLVLFLWVIGALFSILPQ
jgi:hypothetical protein